MYDWLIVGAGFAGSVLAERLASERNERVLLIDRRNHIGGNAYDRYDDDGLLIHQYGPHIFHTNSKQIVEHLSRFTDWRPLRAPRAGGGGRHARADPDQSRHGQQALRAEPHLRRAAGLVCRAGREDRRDQDIGGRGGVRRRPRALRKILPRLYPQAMGTRSFRTRQIGDLARADPHEPGRPLLHATSSSSCRSTATPGCSRRW